MNLEILKNKIALIGVSALVLIIIASMLYIGAQDDSKLNVFIDGQETEESFFTKFINSLSPAWVGGILAEGGGEGPWIYYMEPGDTGTINVMVHNDYTVSVTMLYKLTVKQNGATIYTSPEVLLSQDDYHDWFFSYTAPSTPGTYRIDIESFSRGNAVGTPWTSDDTDYFDVEVTAAEVPDDPTPTPDPTPDPDAPPECPNYCVGTTQYYQGYMVDGTCVYQTAQVDGLCGYTAPSDDPDPCEGVTCPNQCVEPYTWQHDGICIDGVCQYVEEANSPNCVPPDSCVGIMCPDDCDGTTRLTDGTCVDGICEYTETINSEDCGYDPDTPIDPDATPAPTPDGIPDSLPEASDTSDVDDDLGIFANFIQWLKDLFNIGN